MAVAIIIFITATIILALGNVGRLKMQKSFGRNLFGWINGHHGIINLKEH